MSMDGVDDSLVPHGVCGSGLIEESSSHLRMIGEIRVEHLQGDSPTDVQALRKEDPVP